MLKKRNLGFTLIELLAVIVIVAIILLITIPVISGLLENTRKGSFKVTAGMIVKAADIEYSKRIVKDQELTPVIYEYVDGEFIGEKDLDYRGERPKDGVISINEEGKVELSIHDGTFCAWKEIDSDEIHIDKKTKEECGIDTVPEPAEESCFTYEDVVTVESFDINPITCMYVLPNSGMGLSNEDINNICSGNEFLGLTSKELVNSGLIAAELLEGYGVISNVVSNNNGVKITDYSDSCPKNLAIPEVLDEKPVVKIGRFAFEEKDLTRVVIPDSVEVIESSAFRNNQISSLTLSNNLYIISFHAFYRNYLTNVTIPNGVKYLDGFDYNQLTNIIIPNTVKYLDGFDGNQLTELVIPNSVKTVGVYAFQGNGLTSLTLGSNIETIGEGAFMFNNLIELTIPGSVKKMDYGAFKLNYIRELTILEGVTAIGSSVFGDNDLISVTLPSTLNRIDLAAFEENQNLEQFIVSEDSENYKSINNALYTKDGTKLVVGLNATVNNISPTATIIGQGAFYGMDITSFTIPNNITTIEGYAFYSNRLTEISIPSSVIEIGDLAFSINSISSVTIPSGVAMIGISPFAYNSDLTEVTVAGDNPNYKSVNNALYTKDGKKLIAGIKAMSNNIEPTVTIIDDYAFAGAFINSVTIPNGVTQIGSTAFHNNYLTEVTIPSSVTIIKRFAFSVNDIVNLTILNGVSTIEEQAFWSNKLTSILIPNSVTQIGFAAFSGNRITQDNAKIDNTEGNVSIGESAFNYNGPDGNQEITPIYLR